MPEVRGRLLLFHIEAVSLLSGFDSSLPHAPKTIKDRNLNDNHGEDDQEDVDPIVGDEICHSSANENTSVTFSSANY